MIIGIGMVKNEADIIEAFVQHNLHFLDELWLIENGSCDDTPAILHQLLEQGQRLVVIEDPSFGYNQSEKISALYQRAVRERKPDYVIPLDADEFIQASSKTAFQTALAVVRPNGVGRWLWRTCVPTDTSTNEIAARFAKSRRREAIRHGKIIIRCSSSKDPTGTIAQGYHSFSRSGHVVPPTDITGATLAHLPIRSRQQLAQKSILGWMANVAHFKTLDPACGYHWGDIYRRIFDLTDGDLLHEAYNYSERTTTTNYELVSSYLTIHGSGKLNLPRTAGMDYLSLLRLVCRSWEASLLHD